MKIEIDENGMLRVTDIPQQRIIAYGMLKLAEKVIDDLIRKSENTIQPASLLDIPKQ